METLYSWRLATKRLARFMRQLHQTELLGQAAQCRLKIGQPLLTAGLLLSRWQQVEQMRLLQPMAQLGQGELYLLRAVGLQLVMEMVYSSL